MLFQLATTATVLNYTSQAELVQAYQQTGCQKSLAKVIESTVRLVIKIAKRYQRNGIDFEDLVAEGTIVVIEAASKFDPSENVKFSNYAAYWIKARVIQHVAANSSTITVASRLGRELQAKLPKLRRMFGPELDAETIALAIDAELSDVEEAMRYLNVRAASLDKPLNASGGTVATLVSDERLSAEEELAEAQEKDNLKARLAAFAATLDPRRQDMFNRCMVAEEPMEFKLWGEEHGISKQRVGQLKKDVEKALRAYMS